MPTGPEADGSELSAVERRGAGRSYSWVTPLAGSVVVVTLIEVVVRGGLFDATFLPPPSAIVIALVGTVQTSRFWAAIGNTLSGWALGLSLSALLAIPLGLTIGLSRFAQRSTRLLVDFLRPIPAPAILPLFVLLFGFTTQLKGYTVVTAAFWPIFFQTLYGVQDLDPVARDTAKAYRVGWFLRFVLVLLPGAVPYIATGLRLAASVALVVTVGVEMVIGTPGIGFEIRQAQYAFQVPETYAIVAAAGLMGVTIAGLLRRGEQVMLKWHASEQKDIAQ